MTALKGIGILPGDVQSYIDHLVPLCALMEIPILVTDAGIKELICHYYPPMEIRLVEPENYCLDPYLREFNTFFYVDFFKKGSGAFHFQDYLTKHRARSVMCLHGNPDKFWNMYWIEQFAEEDIILAYGPQLSELIHNKGVKKKPIHCGNYRWEFYKHHETFFDQKFPFKKERPTLLYAPTWAASGRKTEHREQFSPFFTVYQAVFDALSTEFQLIVKLHPHLIKCMPHEVEKVKEEYPHIFFLSDYPLIYPLLKQIDYYLGDYSSIGYDFLTFNKPLFFLETAGSTALHQCGVRIGKEDLSHLKFKLHDTFSQERSKLYSEVFGHEKKLSQLRKEIEDAYRSAPDRS